MARTTATAVKGILGSNYGENAAGVEPSLEPFIEAAGSLLDDAIDCAAAKSVTLTTAKREVLERWLAAHFYWVSDQGYRSKATADGSASFQGETGKGLDASHYGQMAVRLDPSGCLAASDAAAEGGGRPVVGLDWLGKVPSEQIPYWQRD